MSECIGSLVHISEISNYFRDLSHQLRSSLNTGFSFSSSTGSFFVSFLFKHSFSRYIVEGKAFYIIGLNMSQMSGFQTGTVPQKNVHGAAVKGEEKPRKTEDGATQTEHKSGGRRMSEIDHERHEAFLKELLGDFDEMFDEGFRAPVTSFCCNSGC